MIDEQVLFGSLLNEVKNIIIIKVEVIKICGISGLYKNNNLDKVDKNLFLNLMEKNSGRGDSAFGILSEYGLIKQTKSFNKKIVKNILYNLDTKFLLGHIRAPTEGTNNIIKNTHPFVTKNFILAHNGIIYNWKELNKKYELKSDMDSKVIINLIQKFFDEDNMSNVQNSIKLTCELLEGSFACWLYFKRTKEVFLFRCISSIKIKNYSFSSEGSGFDLGEGIIYNFTQKKVEEKFKFYTPYEIKENILTNY